jgi:hypothetical protein
VAFDPGAGLGRAAFFSMLKRLRPPAPPWDAIDWPPQVHLALFVHRVEGLAAGLYAYLRDDGVLPEWRSAMRPDFLWEPVNTNDPNGPNDLFLLVPFDCRQLANRVSCDQDIAEDASSASAWWRGSSRHCVNAANGFTGASIGSAA